MKKILFMLGLALLITQPAQAQLPGAMGSPGLPYGFSIPSQVVSPVYGFFYELPQYSTPQYGVQASPIVTPRQFGARSFPVPGITTPQQPTTIQPGITVFQPGFGQLGQPSFQPGIGVTQPQITTPGTSITQPGF